MKYGIAYILLFMVFLLLLLIHVQGSGTPHEKILFFDDFESYPVGSEPSAWELWFNQNGKVTDERSFSGSKSFELLGSYGWAAHAVRQFSSRARVIGYEAHVMVAGYGNYKNRVTAAILFTRRTSSTTSAWYAAVAFYGDGTIRSGGKIIGRYEPDRWYWVRVIWDRDSGIYKVWLDGSLVADINVEYKDPYSVEGLSIDSDWGEEYCYFDDVKVFELPNGGQETVKGDIWTDRGGQGLNTSGGIYRIGDNILIYFQVDTDSHVQVVDEYPNGSRKILFDSQIAGGKVYKLSGVMGQPPGYRIFHLIANGQEVDSSRVDVLSTPECSVTTDKPKYMLGENVQIKMSPKTWPPVADFGYQLRIYMPNGTELEKINCQSGIDTYELKAGPVPGQYKVELWFLVFYPNATSEVCSSTQYEVVQPEYVKFRGIVKSIASRYDIEISINEVIHDPEGKLKPGDTAHLDISCEENCNVSWPLQKGDIVEVYARHYVYNYQWNKNYSIGVWIYSRNNPYDGYVEKIGETTNRPPVALLKVSPQNANVGESITFDASGSYDPDGRVVEYYFDFGDGNTHGWTQSPVVSYSYSKEGTYKARVRVKDDNGARSDWSYVEIYISAEKENKPPVAYIDSITPNPSVQGQTVQFKGHGYDEDGSITICEWSSSIDGLLSDSCSFETSKLSAGKHTIYFRVRDDKGAWSNTASLTLNVMRHEESVLLNEKAVDFLVSYYRAKSDLFKSLADNLDQFTDIIPKVETILKDMQKLAKKYEDEVIPSTPTAAAKKITLDAIKDMFKGVSTLDNEATIMRAVLDSFRLLNKNDFVAWLATKDAHGKVRPLINDLNTVSKYYSEVSDILESYKGKTTMKESDSKRIRDLLKNVRQKLYEIKVYRERNCS